MAKRRSKFTRLGKHFAHDKAFDVRQRAATGELSALAELEALNSAATPESLRVKIWEIVFNHLANSAEILCEVGGGPPTVQGRASDAYAEALTGWVAQARDDFEFDSPEGRAVEIARLCAHALQALDSSDDAFKLGFVLGYGISQKNHLLVREFADGPALAREAKLQAGRADGGEARANMTRARDADIKAKFAAAKVKNPSLTNSGWARKHAPEWGLSSERIRGILRAKRSLS